MKPVITGMPDPENSAEELLELASDSFLTPLQAACHLGITAELLFAYTAGMKAKPSRLETTEKGGKTFFQRDVLDKFDRYLDEPWTTKGGPRPSVPVCIENHLRAESGNQCTRCWTGQGVETAHIEAWADSRSHHHHNLIRLCRLCHAAYDQNKNLTVDEVRKIKHTAITRTRETLRNRMVPAAARFQSPFPAGVLEGRAEEVNFLRDALRSSRAVLIQGPGGVGKTQLLVHALGKVETGRRVVWVDVDQVTSAEAILTALQVLLIDELQPTTGTTLPNQLDTLSACVVLDGVEQANGLITEAVDDLLDELSRNTVHAQFVVTSQVDLQRTVFDERQVLAGLAYEPSRRLLRSALRSDTYVDADSEKSLLAFAGGHPLTLELVAKQADYLGSGQTVSTLIKHQGAAAVEIPKRKAHNRKTSLQHCLSRAYEQLNRDEKRTLYFIACCPGGILTQQLKSDDHCGSITPLLLAELRRWSLVQTKEMGKWDERSHMLSPIRSYVRQRWSDENPTDTQKVVQTLVVSFAKMVATVERNSGSADNIRTMLTLYRQELPNLLFVIDEAEAHPENSEHSTLVSGICYGLMRFFFIQPLPQQGSQLMARGIKIALRDGDVKRASEHAAMMVSLAQRCQDEHVLTEADSMLKMISAEDAETKGNVALTRAMLASSQGDGCATEQHSQEAIVHFEAVRVTLKKQLGDEDEQALQEESSNNLSASFHMLGDGLLGQRRVKEAHAAYEKALELLCGDTATVNKGQILHQIGNCLSGMQDYADAASFYARAAVCFQEVRMQEYLSHALAGLGYALVEVDDDMPFPSTVSSVVLDDGLDDIVKIVLKYFSSPCGLDQKACNIAIGKLFGVVVVLSFSDIALRLGPVEQKLSRDINQLRAEVAVGKDVDSADQYAWNQLEALLTFMSSIATFEAEVTDRGCVREDNTTTLAMSCAFQIMWTDRKVYPLDWLGVYLRRKWSWAT